MEKGFPLFDEKRGFLPEEHECAHNNKIIY
jgi:hypothetical protein